MTKTTKKILGAIIIAIIGALATYYAQKKSVDNADVSIKVKENSGQISGRDINNH